MSGGQIIETGAQIIVTLAQAGTFAVSDNSSRMSEAVVDLEEGRETPTASSAGPSLPARKSRASELWEFFDRDPPLGQTVSQTGSKSTNPFAICKSCKGEKFHPKPSAMMALQRSERLS